MGYKMESEELLVDKIKSLREKESEIQFLIDKSVTIDSHRRSIAVDLGIYDVFLDNRFSLQYLLSLVKEKIVKSRIELLDLREG